MTALSDSAIDSVLAHPALIWKVIAPDDPEALAEASGRSDKKGFLSRLFGGKKAEELMISTVLTFEEGELTDTDLDKAWHGIHFLLTGSGWGGDPPLNFLVAGGTQVGDIDVGYGPARVFRSSEVLAIRNALMGIREDDLRGRFEPDEMMRQDIYPAIWKRDPGDDDTLGYLLEYFDELKRFLAETAVKGLGMVVTLG